MENLVQYLIDNWGSVVSIAIAFLASIDKVGLMFFKTLRNVIDYYTDSFPKKEE